jgi:hypothetical protein
MLVNRKAIFSCVVLLFALAAAPLAKPASFSFAGTFTGDDNLRLFNFTLNSTSSVTLPTWSYGGGTDASGQLIPSGGFSTVLSLFSGSGTLIDFAIAGGCPPQRLDASTGLCGDTILKHTLTAGNYILALTEDFNIPNGLNLSDGFLEDGQGNFSGPLICGVSGSFYDFDCNKRNGNFALDIIGADTASAGTNVPEPANFLLFCSGFAALALFLGRCRKKFGGATC